MRFTRFASVAVPLVLSNVDTDQLIPARFLNKSRKTGLGQYLMRDLRFRSDGFENTEFILNQIAYRGAQILVAGPNFGCGSSRENAVHALADFGFRCIVAPSFGDIFFANCFKNRILPIRLDAELVSTMQKQLLSSPGLKLIADPERQEVLIPGSPAMHFELDAFRKEMLMEGIDEIDLTMRKLKAVRAYEAEMRK
ncbi:MAG: 3-isopropylmalate dehydratase small subunit [Pseudaminobacter sp.]